MLKSLSDVSKFVVMSPITFKPLEPRISLREVSLWSISKGLTISLKNLIKLLEALPGKNWSFSNNHIDGTVPFTVTITYASSGGIHILTEVTLSKNGTQLDKKGGNGPFSFPLSEPGLYMINAFHTAITNQGYIEDNQTFNIKALSPTNPPNNPQPGTNNIMMRVIANQGIFIDQVMFDVKGPGAPLQPIFGINQIGQFFASITVPEASTNQVNQYSVQASAAFHTNEFGIGQPLQSTPTNISLGKDNIGMLFTLGFIPETDQFFLTWTGNL